MNTFSYYLIYFTSGLMGVYSTYRLMNVFFKEKRRSLLMEFFSYIFFYAFINFLYLKINIPILTMIGNIICLIIISYNYKASNKNRFVAVLLILLVLITVETIIALLTGYVLISIYSPNPEYTYILGYVLIKFIGFFVVLFIENYNNVKKGSQIATSYLLSILVISLSSLYIIISLVGSDMDTFQISIIISLLFMMIMIIFYIYDGLKASAEMEIENAVLDQEKKYYMKQFELMKSSVDSTRSLKHDIRNHIGAIGSLINNDEKSKALDYIKKLGEYTTFSEEHVSTGNLVIDSILNYKLDSLKATGAKIVLDILVPSDLELKSFDMVVILANLLDNAIDALKKLDKDKVFTLSIKYDLGLLIINCKNTFDGDISIENGKLVTSKLDKKNHGLGLKNIESVLDKYNGDMKYSYTDDYFMVDILMYVV